MMNARTTSNDHTTSSEEPAPRTLPGLGALPAAIARQSCLVVSKSKSAQTMSARSSNGQTPVGG
jgi:hypothetical protein